MPVRIAAFAAVLTLVATGAPAQNAPTIDFERHVRPIFAAKCLSCHSGEKRSGALSLATYSGVLDGGRNGGAVRPGDSAGSLLMRRIRGEVAPGMPLGKDPLTPPEVAVIRAWID